MRFSFQRNKISSPIRVLFSNPQRSNPTLVRIFIQIIIPNLKNFIVTAEKSKIVMLRITNFRRLQERTKKEGQAEARRQGDHRGRSQDGFNEDRRICPIKMSCKDPRLEVDPRSFAKHRNSTSPQQRPLLIRYTVYRYTRPVYPFRYIEIRILRSFYRQTLLRGSPSENWPFLSFNISVYRINIHIFIFFFLEFFSFVQKI